ncbi:hypothetical protein GCM10011396_11600 [Undibacterium terreum]|uniref:Uncharacterized protein n=1 Tax=Undibacterium terreum TaxID=1224302 RepID=A0A916UAU3_9BURK|nr:hypothetical protein GCM10011396_11600 [Undibacterium terreum]
MPGEVADSAPRACKCKQKPAHLAASSKKRSKTTGFALFHRPFFEKNATNEKSFPVANILSL